MNWVACCTDIIRYLYEHIKVITRIERGQFQFNRIVAYLQLLWMSLPGRHRMVLTHRQARRKQIQWSHLPVRRSATSRRSRAGSVLANCWDRKVATPCWNYQLQGFPIIPLPLGVSRSLCFQVTGEASNFWRVKFDFTIHQRLENQLMGDGQMLHGLFAAYVQ